MKALVQDRYGPADVLRLAEIDRPVPAPHEVLVRVRAAAVNRGDAIVTQGIPYIVRLFYGLRRPKSPVPGTDFAGEVVEAGAAVSGFHPGDAVFGWGSGALAEYTVAEPAHLQPRPEAMAVEQAAGLGVSAFTALHALRDRGRVRAGQSVLVNGAAGGVGTYAVQLAKAFGADVTAVCSAPKADLVRSIGADHVIDYATEDFMRNGRRYDVLVDVAGNRPLAAMRRVVKRGGVSVPVGNVGLGPWLGGLDRMLRAAIGSLFDRRQGRPFVSINNGADLAVLRELAESRRIVPVIDRTYPLAEAPDAFRHVAAGHATGKVVVLL